MVLATYMSLLVNVTLTAIAWGSLLAGTPFTIQYAREQVAPEFWSSPLFVRINQYITGIWGLAFFLSALVSLYREVSGLIFVPLNVTMSQKHSLLQSAQSVS